MTRIARITFTLASCASLIVVGSAGAASAHPRHIGTAHPTTHHQSAGNNRHSNSNDWCC